MTIDPSARPWRMTSDPSRPLQVSATIEFLYPTSRDQFVDQRLDPLLDLVADPSDLLDGLPGWVGEVPIQVSFAGKHRAGVSAAHRDDDVGGHDDVVGEGLGELLREIEADLCHHLHDLRVDLFGWRAPGRADVDPTLGVVIEQRRCHLAAPRVVDACEQHLRDVRHDPPLVSRHRSEPVTGEALSQRRKVRGDPGAAGERRRGLLQDGCHRLGGEHSGELVRQPLDRACAARDGSLLTPVVRSTGTASRRRGTRTLGTVRASPHRPSHLDELALARPGR